jgi:hypothetical protein
MAANTITTILPSPTPHLQNRWEPDNEKLLKDWAEKAKSYRWLHHRTSARYSHRSQVLTILISVLSYVSGGSVLTSNFDGIWFKYFIGYLSILGGILTNVNGLVAWKQLAQTHKVISTEFSSFERSISSMLSIHTSQRVDAIEFINIKRKELDDLIATAPNIPTSIITQYEALNNNKELSHFWIAFYYICCCNRGLRTHLLTDSQRHIEENITYTNPTFNRSAIATPVSRPIHVMREQPIGRDAARASISSARVTLPSSRRESVSSISSSLSSRRNSIDNTNDARV